MVYVALKYARGIFLNIWGCVKVNLIKPLKDFVVVDMEGIENFKIDVACHTLLDVCFYYR